MPLASETRTTFPVLRRGRRLSLRTQGSGACTSQQQRSTATASNDEHPLHHQIRTAPSKSSFHHGQAATTTITSTSQPVTQDEVAEESQLQTSSSSSTAPTPQRRKRRSLLNPHLKVAAAKLKLPRKAPPTPQACTNSSDTPASASPDIVNDEERDQDRECPICQDPVGVPNPEGHTEIWGQLHCGHRFGQQCILTWILDSLTQNGAVNPCCPMCREEICHPCGHPLLQLAISHARNDEYDDDDTDEDVEGDDGYELTRENEIQDIDEDEPETRRERALVSIAHMRHRISGMSAVQRLRGGARRVRSITVVHQSAAILCFLADVMVLLLKSIRLPRLRFRIISSKAKRNEVALVPPAGYCRRCRDEKEE